jgi:glucose-1-phosphate cytidylyltransferase
MKAVILAGGFGTRLSEETMLIPKPMVEIGGKPILWHIMNIFAANGVTEFVIALGYKGELIKDYFVNFRARNNDISVDLASGTVVVHDGNQPGWKVHLVDTGLHTATGGRLEALRGWLEGEDTFLFTYGDGVADINMTALLDFHKSHGKLSTVTAVRAPQRFGRIGFDGDRVSHFYEKPRDAEGWINGGYFVLNLEAIDYIEGPDTPWEVSPVERLTSEGELMGYRHYGFWSCMDTLKEKNILEDLWSRGEAPWKIW